MLSAVLLLLLCSCVATRAQDGEIKIDSLHIRSDIRHRFSQTLVTSQISNRADFAQDVTFDVRLPNEAFISGYSMLVDGVIYPGRVEEKAAANRRFEEAVSRGESAGKVATTSARETNEFVITVNVAAHSNVTFNLTYHELLQRRMGLYEHVIHVNPGEVIPDLRIHVVINESREITELTVPEVRGDTLSSQVITGENQFAQVNSLSPNAVEVTFAPTPDQQRQYSPQGVSGQFIVNYDVDRTLDSNGELLVSKGYFVHFFAPENLPPMGKRIVFVLDTSGSMSGRKIEQLREALVFILGELRPVDEFGILLFSNDVQEWQSEGMVPATPENVARAKEFAGSIRASGGTNINAALLSGLSQLSYHVSQPSLLLFLTDGQATVGETTSDNILSNVRAARHARQSLYSLAFGNGADFDLLKKLSAQNQGFARKIFEDADSALQLAGFYNEISSPLLSEVVLSYISDFVNDTTLTRSSFTTFFSGSEIVVAGRWNNSGEAPSKLSVFVEGSEASGYAFRSTPYCIRPWRYCPTPYAYHPPIWPCPRPCPPPPPPPSPPVLSRPTTFIERLWVYLTIKQQVEKILEIDNSTSMESKKAEAEALRLSLKYDFVTPYTTMVATRPNNVPLRSSFGSTPQAASGNVGQPGRRGQAGIGGAPLARRVQGFPAGGSSCPSCKVIGVPFPVPSSNGGGPVLNPFQPPPPSFGPRPGPAPVPQPAPATQSVDTPTGTPEPAFPSGLTIELNMTTPEGRNGALCLDIVTSAPPSGSRLVLLNDTLNGLVITGTLYSKAYGDHRKFESVSVRLNGSEVLTVSLKSVSIRGRSHPWWRLSSLSEAGVTVSDGKRVELTTPGNASLVFHKYGIETRRSLSSPFIAVTVGNTDNLGEGSTGLLGSVLELSDVWVGVDSRLHYTRSGTEMEVGTSEDKLIDGAKCYRISAPADLRDILDL